MSRPRKASGTAFPYGYPGLTCYFELRGGELVQAGGRVELREAILRAHRGESELFAVWPGQWRSGLFRIDDLRALAVETKTDLDAPPVPVLTVLTVGQVKVARKMISKGVETVESMARILDVDEVTLQAFLADAA